MAEMTILLVSAHRRRKEQIAAVLRRANYGVREPATPSTMIEMLAAAPVHLILADVGSLDEHGQHIVQALCRESSGPPMVVLADTDALDAIITCAEAGAAGCIQLPASSAQLLQVLERVQAPAMSMRKDPICPTESWSQPNTPSPAPA